MDIFHTIYGHFCRNRSNQAKNPLFASNRLSGIFPKVFTGHVLGNPFRLISQTTSAQTSGSAYVASSLEQHFGHRHPPRIRLRVLRGCSQELKTLFYTYCADVRTRYTRKTFTGCFAHYAWRRTPDYAYETVHWTVSLGFVWKYVC